MFRCTVIGPGLLQWAVESINTFDTNPIRFNLLRDMPGTIPDPFPEVTNVTLISVVQDTENPFQGALISEITVLVTSNTLGKHVYCSHGQLGEQETPSILIQSASKCSFMANVSLIHNSSSQVFVCLFFTGVVCWVWVSSLSSFPLQLCSVLYRHMYFHVFATLLLILACIVV